MNFLPLEKQVCTLEQAKELAELLGEHAPGSLCVWVRNLNSNEFEAHWKRTVENDWIDLDGEFDNKTYPAYTGDELGALFKNVTATLPNCHISLTARDKAALAIQGLREGWIKKEEFKF